MEICHTLDCQLHDAKLVIVGVLYANPTCTCTCLHIKTGDMKHTCTFPEDGKMDFNWLINSENLAIVRSNRHAVIFLIEKGLGITGWRRV